jgi:hypothetical protein
MRYVESGGIRLSALGFGCGSVMGRVGRAESLRAMEAAWDAGVTLFDTARSYGYGEAEGLLGEFLVGKRERAVVVTKFGILPSRTSALKRLAKPVVRAALSVLPQARGLVRRGIAGEMSAGHLDIATLRTSLEDSLRALRTEYVDVLLMHEAPEDAYLRDDLMAELAKMVEEGKARRVGGVVDGKGRDAGGAAWTGTAVGGAVSRNGDQRLGAGRGERTHSAGEPSAGWASAGEAGGESVAGNGGRSARGCGAAGKAGGRCGGVGRGILLRESGDVLAAGQHCDFHAGFEAPQGECSGDRAGTIFAR